VDKNTNAARVKADHSVTKLKGMLFIILLQIP